MLKKFLEKLFALYKDYGENVGPMVDILATLGILRDSKRRNRKVINEKFWPKGALDSWHTTRFSQLMGQLPLNQSHILDVWMHGLAEAQQNHFKVSVANLSYGSTPEEEVTHISLAVAFLREMTLEPTNDFRTAKADARDFIKVPATEYPIIWLERLAGKTFTNPDELRNWLIHSKNQIYLAIEEDNIRLSTEVENKWAQLTGTRPAPPATGFLSGLRKGISALRNYLFPPSRYGSLF